MSPATRALAHMSTVSAEQNVAYATSTSAIDSTSDSTTMRSSGLTHSFITPHTSSRDRNGRSGLKGHIRMLDLVTMRVKSLL